MITGLEYFRLRAASEGLSAYGVLVTTMTKLYQFQGTLSNRMDEKPFLQPLFHSYLNAKGKITFESFHIQSWLNNNSKPS